MYIKIRFNLYVFSILIWKYCFKSIYKKNGNIYQINTSNFDSIKDEFTFLLLNIYNHWDINYEKMHPELMKIAYYIETSTNYNISVGEIYAKENQALLDKINITMIPSLVLYHNKDIIYFPNERFNDIFEFINFSQNKSFYKSLISIDEIKEYIKNKKFAFITTLSEEDENFIYFSFVYMNFFDILENIHFVQCITYECRKYFNFSDFIFFSELKDNGYFIYNYFGHNNIDLNELPKKYNYTVKDLSNFILNHAYQYGQEFDEIAKKIYNSFSYNMIIYFRNKNNITHTSKDQFFIESARKNKKVKFFRVNIDSLDYKQNFMEIFNFKNNNQIRILGIEIIKKQMKLYEINQSIILNNTSSIFESKFLSLVSNLSKDTNNIDNETLNFYGVQFSNLNSENFRKKVFPLQGIFLIIFYENKGKLKEDFTNCKKCMDLAYLVKQIKEFLDDINIGSFNFGVYNVPIFKSKNFNFFDTFKFPILSVFFPREDLKFDINRYKGNNTIESFRLWFLSTYISST